jgi:sugar fermentation stimulation protein A
MRFQTELVPARLIRRYNRFLSDAELESTGEVVRAHCPNPGSMMGLKDPGLRIWLEPNNDPRKKLNYGWRLVELSDGHWSGIDTGVPNKVVGEALRSGAIPELADWPDIRPEVKYRANSRVDFLCRGPGRPDAYVEVKNVHLRRDADWAEFPDSVTSRGAKHLGDLSAMVAEGHRAVMLYLVQRTDCARLKMAADLDPTYAAAFDAARAAGVEMLCYGTRIDRQGVELGPALPVDPARQSSGA